MVIRWVREPFEVHRRLLHAVCDERQANLMVRP